MSSRCRDLRSAAVVTAVRRRKPPGVRLFRVWPVCLGWKETKVARFWLQRKVEEHSSFGRASICTYLGAGSHPCPFLVFAQVLFKMYVDSFERPPPAPDADTRRGGSVVESDGWRALGSCVVALLFGAACARVRGMCRVWSSFCAPLRLTESFTASCYQYSPFIPFRPSCLRV